MKKLQAASLSILVNLLLMLLKLAASAMTGSIGIFAEVLHSFLDLLASLFAYLGIRKAQEPEDKSHPYGHEKFENLSSLAQVVLIALTSVWIAYEAVQRYLNPMPIGYTAIGLGVMLVALFSDWLISRYLHKVSKEQGSVALEADAYHFTSDIWSTVAVIIGLALSSFGFHAADSLAALVVALFMLRLSFSLGGKSLSVLVDRGASIEELERIVAVIARVKEVRGYHKLRARHMGSKLMVDLHIQLEPGLPLLKAHRVSHKLKGKIMAAVPEAKDVLIHIEPYGKI